MSPRARPARSLDRGPSNSRVSKVGQQVSATALVIAFGVHSISQGCWESEGLVEVETLLQNFNANQAMRGKTYTSIESIQADSYT